MSELEKRRRRGRSVLTLSFIFVFRKGLNRMKETTNLLIMDKGVLTDEVTTKQIFQHLEIGHLKYVLEHFMPDE